MEFYAPMVNSPPTYLTEMINSTVKTIEVEDGSKLPAAPNLATLGAGEFAETILYQSKTGNVLSNVTRGFEGTAKNWDEGSRIVRVLTAYDISSLQQGSGGAPLTHIVTDFYNDWLTDDRLTPDIDQRLRLTKFQNIVYVTGIIRSGDIIAGTKICQITDQRFWPTDNKIRLLIAFSLNKNIELVELRLDGALYTTTPDWGQAYIYLFLTFYIL